MLGTMAIKRNVFALAITIVASGWTDMASAACAVPPPPVFEGKNEKPAPPPKPACLSAKEGCPGWEAYSYNDAIKAYNLKAEAYRPLAQDYVKRLNDYVKAAADYAQCEVKSLQ